ncbi:quinoprotein relay system zinc metallohydrolase 2 [Roseobacter sp. EG26]|uniref:quinoprotein relay system zinc metallohydrolase 2 n=1 Tax=Roseobacter sp. EG26 TaxID=3412477 RepID=UPI003CE48604
MFEAVIALCVALAGGPCRDHLLPGYEAQDPASCEAALIAKPPDLSAEAPLVVKGAARCQQAGDALSFSEVADGVFVHVGAIEEPDKSNRGDTSNLGFVIGESSVAVIDTGTARWMGEAVWRAIRQRTNLPVSHVILTHVHPDHVLGTAAFSTTDAQVIGHANLSRALADRASNYIESLDRLIGTADFLGTRAVAVDTVVENDMMVDLGGRTLRLQAWPTAHTGTDITIFDVATGTLFAGDLVFDRHTPALDGSLRGWRAVMAELQAFKLNLIVPGHGGPTLRWPEGAAAMTRYLGVLEADTREAIDTGMRLGAAVETIAQSEADRWQLFDAYNPRNATVAFTELEWE